MWHILLGLTALVSAATLAGFGGEMAWSLELASHFRWHYVLFLLPAALLFAGAKRPFPAVVAAVFAVVNLAAVAPLYVAPAVAAAPGKTYRAVMLNVHWTSDAYEPAIEFIRETDPDFFVLAEVTPAWEEALRPLTAAYPYVSPPAYGDEYSVMLYSRIPFVDNQITRLLDGERPSVLARLDVPGGPLTVVGMHPPAPMRPARIASRNGQMARAAHFLETYPGAVMVLGDLNMTPWSPHFHDFIAQSGLQNGRDGFGVQPTWPATNPSLLRIPIDHALVTPDITVHNFSAGPNVQSDHLPIVIDFSLAAPEMQAH